MSRRPSPGPRSRVAPGDTAVDDDPVVIEGDFVDPNGDPIDEPNEPRPPRFARVRESAQSRRERFVKWRRQQNTSSKLAVLLPVLASALVLWLIYLWASVAVPFLYTHSGDWRQPVVLVIMIVAFVALTIFALWAIWRGYKIWRDYYTVRPDHTVRSRTTR